MTAQSDISAALLSARRKGRALDAFPGPVPATPAEAYAIQHASIRAWEDELVGFKVGGIPAAFADSFPGGWLAGPVFKNYVYPVADGGTADVPAIEGGMAAYEAEFIMKLSGLERLDGPLETLSDAKSFVETVHIGTEIAQSPFKGTNPSGPGAIIADFGVQGGVVLGPEAGRDVLDRLEEINVSVAIDGELIGTATPNGGERGPLGALRFLLNHIQTLPEDISMPNTIWLSSGAITGVHQSKAGTKARITFAGLGSFDVRLPPRNSNNPITRQS